MKVLIFGGTTEGKELCEFLLQRGAQVVVSVATEYGKSLMDSKENLSLLTGRMDQDGMKDCLKAYAFDYVIDATHPYAGIVTENIKTSCTEVGTKYMRIIRKVSDSYHHVTKTASAEQAVNLLKETHGNIFLTTGSKDLEVFTKMDDYAERCYVRILPMPASLDKAIRLGFAPARIICMQGPFDKEMNQVMFRLADAKYIVTKDSGENGGFDEKITAASELGCEVIVITRPVDEEGYTWQEMIDFFRCSSI